MSDHLSSNQQSLLEQWASLVATEVVNELEDVIGLGDGDAVVICDAVIASVVHQSLPHSGGDLLRRALARPTDETSAVPGEPL